MALGSALGLVLLVVIARVVVEVSDGRLHKEPPCRCAACERKVPA
jgi:hypothetical protein